MNIYNNKRKYKLAIIELRFLLAYYRWGIQHFN